MSDQLISNSKSVGNPNHPAPMAECPFVKQATDAFLVFDSEKTETVDVREVGTIIRSLGE